MATYVEDGEIEEEDEGEAKKEKEENEGETKDHEGHDTGAYIEDGEIEEEEEGQEKEEEDVFQLAHHGASVLQGQGQILAVLIH